MHHKAVVAGAGIAGLSAAIALARQGWDVTVLERARRLDEVGAGFAMSRNAVAAFTGLGFTDADVAALGMPTRAEGTRSSSGAPIMLLPQGSSTSAKTALIGVHRRRLHQALVDGATRAGVQFRTDSPVTEVESGEADGASARLAGEEADLVVAADGMFSAVRRAIFPSARLVYSGYSSWRAIAPRTHGETTLRQYWGPHAEFGILPVAEHETYWYGYAAMAEHTTVPDELAAARERFAGWAEPAQQIMAETEPEAVMRHDVHHLPGGLKTYTRGRVVMIGDAAHGFLPTMGQGAATALEDGLCVGLLIGAPVTAGGSLARALDGFDAARRPRCRGLGRASVLSARIGAHLGGGMRQRLRNALMGLAPTSALNRAADSAMGWTPPPPAAPQ